MADGRHIENRFWYISAPYWPINVKSGPEMKNHMQILCHVTNSAIFANPRWQMAAILKIASSPYFISELSDFDQIWYADANFHSDDEHLTKI